MRSTHRRATKDDGTYRRLQRHLDRQPVGFPATRSGHDIRFLKRLFTSEQAALALHLSYKPMALDQIVERATPAFTAEQVEPLLESMVVRGAIAWKKKDERSHWYLIPFVVGMYEAQDGKPSAQFLTVASAYASTIEYGISFLAVKPSQMRTVPINQSIPVEHNVATYDQINEIIRTSESPFAVLKCMCREAGAIKKKPCTKTAREETCIACGDIAAMILRRNHGREVTREEALVILRQNEADGLVLQAANAQRPQFVCACCGCCCGMLSFQKKVPHPVDFWTTNFHAVLDADACTGCGICVERCQVNAVTLAGTHQKARINRSRCIGCGLCVPACPTHAVKLVANEHEKTPPENDEVLYDQIMANKKGLWGRMLTVLKVVLRMRQ